MIIFYLRLPEAQVMRYCRENDGSPNVLLSVLLARTIRRMDPDSDKTVTSVIALASIRQMSRQVSRGSAGEYQADERAGVT